MKKPINIQKKYTISQILISVSFIISIFYSNHALSASVWTGGSGNWSVATNWSPVGVPLSTDDVIINSGSATITINDPNTSCGTLDCTGFSGILQIGASSLNIGGFAILPCSVTISTGTLNVDGDLNVMGGSITFSDAGNIKIGAASISSLGTYTNTIGTVWYDRLGDQSILAGTYYNLKSAGSGFKTLAGNIQVKSELNFVADSKVATGNYTLSLGVENSANGSIVGASASRYIIAYDNNAGSIGKVKQFINSVDSYIYPIGDATYYTPFTISINLGTTLNNASLVVYTKASKVSGMNTSIATYLNRFWSYEPTGITTPSYDLLLNYNQLDVAGTEANLLPIKKSGAVWYVPTQTQDLTGVTEQGSGVVDVDLNQLSWTGLSTFSEVGGAGDENIQLPINLLSFNVACNGENVNINWSTLSEMNNDYFTIEKSSDLASWIEVAKVDGAGNSNSLLNYSINDNKSENVVYYRLKQTDFDGNFEYFDALACSCSSSTKEEFNVFPNPTQDDLNIKLFAQENENLYIEIYNTLGKRYYSSKLIAVEGINTILLSNLNLDRNTYQIRVISSLGKVYNQMVVVN